ncbi:MAG: zinc ABC transporter substrate-binding protein [Anaerolineae bacterium]
MLTLGSALIGGCTQGLSSDPPQRPVITVSIIPQRFFVQQIAGDRVEVNVMVQPGESPATYEPTPAQLKALSASDGYFHIGVPFENAWLPRIAAANSAMIMVDTAEGIDRVGEGENPDPHIWLSPNLVKIQARTIYEALEALDPAHATEYAANLDAFQAEIDGLDADIQDSLAGIDQRQFIVLHPSWRYFARDYGLEMIAVEVGGQEPSAAELVALIDRARREGIRVVFAQPEFSTKAAETIANEIGGEVLLISPLAEDWMANMRSVANTFAEALSQ